MQNYEEAIKAATSKAVETVQDGQIIGLGSGRSVAQALIMIAEKIERDHLKLSFVPSSYQIEFLTRRLRLQLAYLEAGNPPDLTLDGADQVEIGSLDMIKGGGGALAREKIIDSCSKRVSIIIDESKLTQRLGEGKSVPVEVLPFGVETVMQRICRLGGEPTLRQAQGKVGPIITDNGNMIVDADFGLIKDPAGLEREIRMIPGVVEVGIFVKVADTVYVGGRSGSVEVLRRE
ncbi:ribose 5-phosphate isomerase A [Candidatus Bathyarchaeota archaeon]|nr:ribose 5-phosphate isomerase A [Candidatus Bathyarchaeota archaeon]